MARKPGQGRRAKPTALKLLEGRDAQHPERINHDEPQYDALDPKAPEWLDAEAKIEWDRIAPGMVAIGLLTVADKAALEAYCFSYALFKHTADEIKRLKISDPDNKLKALIKFNRDAMADMRSWAALFGLTPSDRTKIKTPGDKKDDLFD